MELMKKSPQNFPYGKETIIVVEDEEALNELIVLVLGTEGYRVISSRDGEEAVQIYKKHAREVSLVFSDYGLPNHNGAEVLRRIKEINPDVKFILTSGYLESEERLEILQAGADSILWKPYALGDMVRVVNEALKK